jgi:hypothetical protein
MLTALSVVVADPGNSTVDGVANPNPPFLGLLKTVDLGKAFGLDSTGTDNTRAELAKTADDKCLALFDGVSSSVQNSNISLRAYQAALAPALELINFNIGMANINLGTYVPCLGNMSAGMAVPTVSVSAPKVPSPKELKDRLNGAVSAAESLAEKTLAALDPLKIVQSQMKAINAAISSVSTQARSLLCVPQALSDALRGGSCGINVPNATTQGCVENNETFRNYLDSVDAYIMMALSLVNSAQMAFFNLGNLVDITVDLGDGLVGKMANCNQQAASFVQNIIGT